MARDTPNQRAMKAAPRPTPETAPYWEAANQVPNLERSVALGVGGMFMSSGCLVLGTST